MSENTTSSHNLDPYAAFRLNLQQQKKRAKELLKSIKSSEAQAISRFSQFHPKFSEIAQKPTEIKLNDAQWVIARELGLGSWAKLKTHIQLHLKTRQKIQNDSLSPDQDYKTLHIRCGSDLQQTLPKANFQGDFLEFSDPYGQGPVVPGEKFLERRAKFLTRAYGRYVNRDYKKILADLQQAESKLKSAATEYNRVVLWFEHDAYDQLILARILAYFKEHPRPARLELVSTNHYPGAKRFVGLGQLPEEAIRLLWDTRQLVRNEQVDYGNRVWNALCDSSPEKLNQLAQSHYPALPYMQNALLRHLQEFPSCYNGLGLTQQLTLELLHQKSTTAGRLFGHLIRAKEPLPWLGDVMYWYILEQMLEAQSPPFDIVEHDSSKPLAQQTLKLNQTGSNLLNAQINWRQLNPNTQYLGGVKLSASHPQWCWDNNNRTVLKTGL